MTAWIRLGAWGQLVVIALTAICWTAGIEQLVLAGCVGYFGVTLPGIVAIARAESAPVGPLVYPFIVPGFVPVYYVVTR